MFMNMTPPHGQRIAVIGAGPAGLTYASLVAGDNAVTVFEKEPRPGGAFRYAGLAPMFQEVEANPASFVRYIDDMAQACWRKRATFQFETDVERDPSLLAPFTRIVVATGASYPFGLKSLATGMLESGSARWPVFSSILSNASLRNWFYYRARRPTGARFTRLARPGQFVTVIGDAAKPGKSKEAISGAFEAALLGG
jgi:hypothetical protein